MAGRCESQPDPRQHHPPWLDIQVRVCTALLELYRHDRELLSVNANERSITHKVGEYLQQQFPRWNVDCEYNRRGADIKKLRTHCDWQVQPDDTEGRIFPDIIVHHRGRQDNLLVIEVKKGDSRPSKADHKKLVVLGECSEYSYSYGIFLSLGSQGCPHAVVYEGGEKTPEKGVALSQAIGDKLEELGYG